MGSRGARGSVCGRKGPALIKDEPGKGAASSLQVLSVITPVSVESTSGSRQRAILPPGGTPAMSGDIFVVPTMEVHLVLSDGGQGCC